MVIFLISSSLYSKEECVSFIHSSIHLFKCGLTDYFFLINLFTLIGG